MAIAETEMAGGDGAARAQGVALLRVSAAKVTRLLDLVGELSLSVFETLRSPDLEGVELTEFEKSAHRLKLVVNEVQSAAAELQLVPVGEVFRRIRRLVRDLERQTSKQIDLLLEGEDTLLDKMLVDRLYEPLVHLVRNAADHGLESAEVRAAAGKPAKGRITLSAAQAGADIRITVADDGRGLNRERVLARARERGLIGPDEVPEDQALWRVLLAPGFSTAETITNLSGRGVGLDVLNTVLKQLRGHIHIDTIAGQGTRMLLSIPMTLAFLDSFVMRVDDRLFATPIEAVAEIFRAGSEQITILEPRKQAEVVHLRDEFIPIRRLQDFYGEVRGARAPLDEMIIVVFNTSAGRVGVPVDEMVGQQQVVMKPLTGHLERIRAGAGCALLGTGEVAIVLDCEKLSDGALP